MLSQGLAQVLGFRRAACDLGNNHKVQALQACLFMSKGVPHDSFDPVSVYRPPRDPTRDRDPQARIAKMIYQGMYREQVVLIALAAFYHSPEVGSAGDSRTLWVGEAGGGFQALTRARPFARRALRTLRPPLVLMRARKPWVFLRLRALGW